VRFVKSLLLAVVVAGVFVPSALAFRFSDFTRLMPVGVVGQPYSHPLETIAGCKGVYITLLAGSLPPGLRITGDKRDDVDGSNWRIEGTPTAAGEYGFWLQARNLCPVDSTEEDFTIRVTGGSAPPPPPPPPPPPAPPVAVQQSSLPAAVTGAVYATKLTATGGSGTQRWSVAGGFLPSGITLAADGTLGGTPRIAGDYKFTVKVEAGAATGSRELTLVVRDPLTASIQAAKQAEVGVALALAPAVAGGVGPYRWAVASGSLPAGIGVDAATGALSGTPQAAGTFPLSLRVTDREGRSKSVSLELTVHPTVAIVTSGLTPFVRGAWTSRAIETTGGVGKKRFKVIAGRLPLGLRLNVNGVLVGTPRAAGRFRVTVQVTDGYKVSATKTLVVTVVKPRR
jgi:hypothetical protein